MSAAMQNHIKIALEKGKFFVQYQPQLDMNGRCVGVEALVRMNSRTGIIPPTHFISVAERSGQIINIGCFVLKTACAQLKTWQDAEIVDDTFTMSINVCSAQIANPNFNAHITKAIQDTGVNLQNIVLELTESAMLSDTNVAKLHRISAAGARIAIDDFGTGYSSLSRLKWLPFNEIKIDRSFIQDLEKNLSDAAVLLGVKIIADALGLIVVVEGVETVHQFEILKGLGFQHYQGFYFA
jgi:EAL domain-containing protein (putative c-di-GMP-specific phosphodiesterase class I)